MVLHAWGAAEVAQHDDLDRCVEFKRSIFGFIALKVGVTGPVGILLVIFCESRFCNFVWFMVAVSCWQGKDEEGDARRDQYRSCE